LPFIDKLMMRQIREARSSSLEPTSQQLAANLEESLVVWRALTELGAIAGQNVGQFNSSSPRVLDQRAILNFDQQPVPFGPGFGTCLVTIDVVNASISTCLRRLQVVVFVQSVHENVAGSRLVGF